MEPRPATQRSPAAQSHQRGARMRIVIGSDAEGTSLKEVVAAYLHELGHEVVDKTPAP